ncbi:137R [Yaba monkey tumor virus]|uniref:137R n=1 Tax=Yaba monkey tumor virus (strain VR587) TaxID=928314 RepID=Q6TUN6_YMTV5|nr:putative transmembrane protein [Yaba monkey tumor virus]AAR07490.1 137R [Yaba monkey tumor virus]
MDLHEDDGTINDYSLFFVYDTADTIDSNDSLKEVLEDYFTWKAMVGRIGFVPSGIGNLFLKLIKLDDYFDKNSTKLLVNGLKRKRFINRLKKYLYSNYDISYLSFITLVGIFGYISERCGKYGKEKYIQNLLLLIFNFLNDNILFRFRYYLIKN